MIDNVLFFLKFKNTVRFFYDSITVGEALSMMKEYGYSAVPVISTRGVYMGSVSEGDFLWYLLENSESENVLEASVGSIIRPEYMPPVSVNVSFADLLEASLHQNYVPVVDDRNIFIGIVTRQSLLNYLLELSQPADTFAAFHQREEGHSKTALPLQ